MEPHPLESLFKLNEVCVKTFGLDYHIIYAYLQALANKVMEDGIHGSSGHGSSILEAKRHYQPYIDAESTWAPKGSFMGVCLGHIDLVVARITVNESQNGVVCRDIDQHVSHIHIIFILWSDQVEVSVVNTYPHLASLFDHMDNIRQQSYIPDGSDEPFLQKPFYFHLDVWH